MKMNLEKLKDTIFFEQAAEKTHHIMEMHKGDNVRIAYSGGSDSDTMIKNDIKLVLIGLRKAEGGRRSLFQNCYVPPKENAYSKYYPLFWWNDEEKKYFNTLFEIQNSDCYTKYGLTRTGCAGCPYGLHFEKELEILKTFEPKLYKLATHIFKNSYRATLDYHKFMKEHR